ncbi:MAG: flavoprotein [Bacillota bacterium]|nr:flavoprotein [Bacillota bacterium]
MSGGAAGGSPRLAGRRVLLGVTGGIAAYKTPTLVRRLREEGAEVEVILTRGAAEFVTPLALETVAGRPVRQALLGPGREPALEHLRLARWAELVLVAPATAHFLAKAAAGLADDLLDTVLLAAFPAAPLLVAPAMNSRMWSHPITRRNVALLRELGVRFVGPETGRLAEEESGVGRMSEPERIVEEVVRLLAG